MGDITKILPEGEEVKTEGSASEASAGASRREEIAEVLKAWDSGDIVWSVELGGLGPGYEQAIQILIMELLRDQREKPLPEGKLGSWGDDTVDRLNESCGGFTGAQVGAARVTAYQFLKYGYKHMMGTAPSDRKIMITNKWPKAVKS